MTKNWKDAVTVGVAGMSRRSSFLTLGGAMVAAALAQPARGEAAKAGKKRRKKARKSCATKLQALELQLREECENQSCEECENQPCEECGDLTREECDAEIDKALEKLSSKIRLTEGRICRTAVEDVCENETNPEACAKRVSPCCDPFLEGDAGSAVRCLLLAFYDR